MDGDKPIERTVLTMTMMDDYMDRNLDQYCTFEDNYFAHHDQSISMQQQKFQQSADMTANDTSDMMGMQDEMFKGSNKNAFAYGNTRKTSVAS